jgi:hypothetical protein
MVSTRTTSPCWLDDLFEEVVKFSTEPELCTLSRANKFISTIARRALYGSITLDQRPSSLRDQNSFPRKRPAQACLEALVSNPDLAILVHTLNIRWQRHTPEEVESLSTVEFGGLLKACLMGLVNLEHLCLDLNVFETFPALNDTFPFELNSFSTNLPWNEDLVAFLGSQALSLRELRLDRDGEDVNIPLQDRAFPAIRVLHWGGYAKVEILSTILGETWQNLGLLHMEFTDTKALDEAVGLLRRYPSIPAKLDFSLDVQGALGHVFGLQTENICFRGFHFASSLDDLMVSTFPFSFDTCWLMTFVGATAIKF